MAVKKKSKRPGFPPKPVSGKQRWTKAKWVCIGGDISMSSISLGGIACTSDGKIRVAAHAVRWQKGTDYFDRMKDAARAHDIVDGLMEGLQVMVEPEDVYFALEEAVSFGHLQRGASNSMKQQVQISGAFIGGLLKWGYPNIYEIQANKWRKLVADDLATLPEFEGMTIHHTKWNPDKKIGKFRAKQWIERFHPKWDGHWADLITDSKLGLIPRPEGRNAQAAQSDDRYEALAMAAVMRKELKS